MKKEAQKHEKRIQFTKIAESEKKIILLHLYCYDRVFINLHLNINENNTPSLAQLYGLFNISFFLIIIFFYFIVDEMIVGSEEN